MTLELFGIWVIGLFIGVGAGFVLAGWYLDYMFFKYASTGSSVTRNGRKYTITEIKKTKN